MKKKHHKNEENLHKKLFLDIFTGLSLCSIYESREI